MLFSHLFFLSLGEGNVSSRSGGEILENLTIPWHCSGPVEPDASQQMETRHMIPMKDQKSTASQDQTHCDFPGNEDVFFLRILMLKSCRKNNNWSHPLCRLDPSVATGKKLLVDLVPRGRLLEQNVWHVFRPLKQRVFRRSFVVC